MSNGPNYECQDNGGQDSQNQRRWGREGSARATGSRRRLGGLRALVHRLSAAFARLIWKLTLSYTLVTAAALAAVEILALGILVAVVNNSRFLPGSVAKAVIESAAQVYPGRVLSWLVPVTWRYMPTAGPEPVIF